MAGPINRYKAKKNDQTVEVQTPVKAKRKRSAEVELPTPPPTNKKIKWKTQNLDLVNPEGEHDDTPKPVPFLSLHHYWDPANLDGNGNPPLPETWLPCRKKDCDEITTLRKTSAKNRNGNGNRMYYGCPEHGFCNWADLKGVHPDNPPCHCAGGPPCRENVSGPDAVRPGRLFWQCADGKCGHMRMERIADMEERLGSETS